MWVEQGVAVALASDGRDPLVPLLLGVALHIQDGSVHHLCDRGQSWQGQAGNQAEKRTRQRGRPEARQRQGCRETGDSQGECTNSQEESGGQ